MVFIQRLQNIIFQIENLNGNIRETNCQNSKFRSKSLDSVFEVKSCGEIRRPANRLKHVAFIRRSKSWPSIFIGNEETEIEFEFDNELEIDREELCYDVTTDDDRGDSEGGGDSDSGVIGKRRLSVDKRRSWANIASAPPLPLKSQPANKSVSKQKPEKPKSSVGSGINNSSLRRLRKRFQRKYFANVEDPVCLLCYYGKTHLILL